MREGEEKALDKREEMKMVERIVPLTRMGS